MIPHFRAVVLVGLSLFTTAPFIPAVSAAPAPDGFADLAESKLPAVVNVATRQKVDAQEQPGLPQLPPGSPLEEFFRDFFGQMPQQRPRETTALGSGFVISPDGYVVTNNHVIQNAAEITVILQDDTELPAELIGRDPMTDLALLKVSSEQPLPALEWGDSDHLRIGDWVLAIGNPFGLGGTVTAGIISARARNIHAGPYDDFLQTDASINRGNSGGPLFAMDGRVVGVNTAILSPTGGSIGIGFAIPSAVAQDVIGELQKTGTVQRGWLGVQLQPLTPEIAQAMGLKDRHGGLVAEVMPQSPAAEAGLEPGDVIVDFEGKAVEDGRDLSFMVASADPGSKAEITIIRNGERSTRTVTLGTLPQQQVATAGQQPDASGTPHLGLTLSPITPRLRQELGIPDTMKGVVITAVDPDAPAAQQGLRPGDVIVRAGDRNVEAPQDIAAAVKQATKSDRRAVLLQVQRADRRFFAAVPLRPSDETASSREQ